MRFSIESDICHEREFIKQSILAAGALSPRKYHHLILTNNGSRLGHPYILEGDKEQISIVCLHDKNEEKVDISRLIEMNFGQFPFSSGKLV